MAATLRQIYSSVTSLCIGPDAYNIIHMGSSMFCLIMVDFIWSNIGSPDSRYIMGLSIEEIVAYIYVKTDK